jgi:methylated-DNA-[protein]-cysteine S-methyltransferase
VNRTPVSDRSSTLCSCTLPSPLGTLTIVASDAGVRAVLWEDDDPRRVRLDHPIERVSPAQHVVLRLAVAQLEEYFHGDRRSFAVPLDARGTAFQQSAWTALCAIPFGTTISYGEQAAAMGDRRKARAVGAANGRNPISIVVPCHRVVGSGGALTGFAGGVDAKAWLLEHERSVANPDRT